MIQTNVNRILQDKEIFKIDLQDLDASSEVAQEYIDFLFRQKYKDDVLNSIILRNFSGMDQPFDSQLLMKVAGKSKFFAVTKMDFDKEKP